MNRNILHQIFQNYIDKFDQFNAEPYIEYYKWQICHEFPILMYDALSTPDEEFASALNKVKKCTYNVIDSYTTPFNGLVELARKEPAVVKAMFKALYSDDGGDLKIRMEKMSDFFGKSKELLEKYYSGSYLYKQNSHSVSAYLFLNDPDNHYMYKASHCKAFAEYIEYYSDWGAGDNIKLEIFHQMCDEVLEEILKKPELLDTDQSRFDGRLKLRPGELHRDTFKHIFLFDIIYCSSSYNLYNGINYTKRTAKEKSLYLTYKEKAKEIKESFDKTKEELELLDEALDFFVDACQQGGEIKHKKYGAGVVESIDRQYIVAAFQSKSAKLSLPSSLANGFVKIDIPDFDEKLSKYRDVLKKNDSIQKKREYYAKELEKYEEYLD